MQDLAEKGFTGVLHTISENDLAYNREQMEKIVQVSHDAGLEVQVGPWGLGHVFGGEAESLFAVSNPELGQVFDNGQRIAAPCPNRPEFRAFVRHWTDIAIETGADKMFWDEPHWAHPTRFGLPTERWSCRCEVCGEGFRERFGEHMPAELTPEVAAFREEAMIDFIREIVAYAEKAGGRSTVCLLPLMDGPHGLSDWTGVASAPGLDTLATDPYWKFFEEPVDDFVGRFSGRVTDLAQKHGVNAQVWVQGFRLGPEDEADIHAAVAAARRAGVEDLWTWGYEACQHLSYLNTREPEKVWKILVEALTG